MRIHSESKFVIISIIGVLSITLVPTILRTTNLLSATMPDISSVLEVRGDMPNGWILREEQKRDYERGISHGEGVPPYSRFSWDGMKRDPAKRAGPGNPLIAFAAVNITRLATPQDALTVLSRANDLAAIRSPSGSYSGKRLGDLSFYSRRPGDAAHLAAVRFVRGPFMFDVTMRGPRGTDMRPEVEALAQTLVDRAAAAIALAASTEISATVAARSVKARAPNGVTVVRMGDYASAVGASLKLDLAGGTAEITKGSRTLKVNIGRREAWLSGNEVTLPFPALRRGADSVYCPLDTLKNVT